LARIIRAISAVEQTSFHAADANQAVISASAQTSPASASIAKPHLGSDVRLIEPLPGQGGPFFQRIPVVLLSSDLRN